MKRILFHGGLIAVLLGCGFFYWRGAREEAQLRRAESEGAPGTTSAATASTLPTPVSATKNHVAEALHPPEVRRWTAEELETFLKDWTAKVKAEEERMIAAGALSFRKGRPFEDALSTMPAEELLALCYGIFPDANVGGVGLNERSPDEEIRNLLFYLAFQAVMRRFPFLSLQLPQNRLDAKPFTEVYHTIRECARSDREAAWEVVQAKFGGREATDGMLRDLLKGAVADDPARRFAQAKAWGILDRVANFWTEEASATRTGQDAWIAALQETAPPDKDARIRNFAKEVETSEGLDGLKRLIPRLAEKGTHLHDSILKEAASRDLEEGAGPKADWILSEVSPASAANTAEMLIKQWTATDPLPASEWLDRIPKSAPWRQAAVLAFAKAIEPHDPEAAALWRKAVE